MTNPSLCPRCAERVTAFAAGCAFCGADLDPRRGQAPQTTGQRMRSAWRARPRVLSRIPLPDRRP